MSSIGQPFHLCITPYLKRYCL